MKWLFWGVLVLAACGDGLNTTDIPEAQNTSDPIVDAKRNSPLVLGNTQRTEVVKVMIPGSGTTSSLCTGTLIAPRLVLTAGHCSRPSEKVFHSTDILVFVRGRNEAYAVMGVIEPSRWMSTDDYGVGYNKWRDGKYSVACTGTAATVCSAIKTACNKNNNAIADGIPYPFAGKTFDEAVCVSGEFAKKVDAAVNANASIDTLINLYIMRDQLADTYGVSIPFFWAEDPVPGIAPNTTGYDMSLLILTEAVASNLATPVAIESLCESSTMQITAQTAPRVAPEACIMGYGGTSPDPSNLLSLGYPNASGTAKYGSVDIASFGGTQLWVRGGRSLGLASNCAGDSGGPVFPGQCSSVLTSNTHRVAGLVSFAADYAGLCTLGSVHTRVGSFAGWIKSWASKLATDESDNTGFVIKSTPCCGDGFPDAGENCDGTPGCSAQCGNAQVPKPDPGLTPVTDAGGSNRTTISFGDDEGTSAEGCSGCHQSAGGSISSMLLLLGLCVVIVFRKVCNKNK